MLKLNELRMLESLTRQDLRKRLKARRLMRRKAWQSEQDFQTFVAGVDARLERLREIIDGLEAMKRAGRQKVSK